MAIELFPLLKRLKVGSYDNCVILTFNADLHFFEQVVLPTLWSRGCRNNMVLMDAKQYVTTLDTTGAQLQRLGKSYSVWPVTAKTAYHPKLILQTNDKRGRLIIGSGNLTVRGYSTNWEVFSEISFAMDSDTGPLFAAAWNLVTESAAGATTALKRQIEQMEKTSGALFSSEHSESWPRLLFASPNQPSLLSQIKAIIGTTSAKRIVVVAPFFDAKLQAIRELKTTFGTKKTAVIVQAISTSFPGKVATKMKSLAVHEFLPPNSNKSSYLHAKAIVIQTASADYTIWGSANCSLAALGGFGNYEAVLVTKMKPGNGIKTLGLSNSLKREQIFDPVELQIINESGESNNEKRLTLISAEVDHGVIVATIKSSSRFSKCNNGRLMLWAKGEPVGELLVEKSNEQTFKGELKSNFNESVICRLALQDDNGEQLSTPVAVHFLQELQKATPSRHQSQINRIVEAIHLGAFDWANGLENVCELVIKIGLNEKPDKKRQEKIKRKLAKEENDDSENTEGSYDDFVSEIEIEDTNDRKVDANSHLEDLVVTLRSQILQGITKPIDDEDIDTESWRYREEADRDAAESGLGESQAEILDVEILEKAHNRVRRAYVSIMRGLKKRFNWLCDQDGVISPDEFWRLDAVNLLIINGCNRADLFKEIGPPLSPTLVMDEYLPALDVFFGRTRKPSGKGTASGPLIDRVPMDQTSIHIKQAVMSSCAVMLGVIAHDRKIRNQQSRDANETSFAYAELSTVRCLAAILRKELMPTQEELTTLINSSSWLSSIGLDIVQEVFDDLLKLSRSVVRCHDRIENGDVPDGAYDIRPGEWIWSSETGVAEVASVSGSQVNVAVTGESDRSFLKLDESSLMRTNIPPKVHRASCEVSEEFNYLLVYSDGDLEEWRELIMSHLKTGYLVSLWEVARHAQSQKLRDVVAALLEQRRTHPP